MAESSLSSLTLRQEKRKYFKTLLPNRKRSDDVISVQTGLKFGMRIYIRILYCVYWLYCSKFNYPYRF